MKKLLITLTLALLAAALLVPSLSLAETIVADAGVTIPGTAVTETGAAIPATAVAETGAAILGTAVAETGAAIPPTGYDWSSLATIAGATAFTLLFVQFVKAPLDKLWHIPTRLIVYLIAFATLLLAQIFTVGFTPDGLLLTAVNAVIAGSAAMGMYEVTFAKQDNDSDQ